MALKVDLPEPVYCPLCREYVEVHMMKLTQIYRQGPTQSERRIYVCKKCNISIRVSRYPEK